MKTLKIILVLITPFILFSSCKKKDNAVIGNDTTIEIKKYPSGKIHDVLFYTKNHLDSVYEYFENPPIIREITKRLSDSTQYIIQFDSLGNYLGKGYTLIKKDKNMKNGWKNMENGWWEKMYKGEKARVEYFIIGDTNIVNQVISLDKNNHVDVDNSCFYTMDLPDTLDYGREYMFTVKVTSPIGDKKDYRSRLEISDAINSGYSNIGVEKSTYKIKNTGLGSWEVRHTFLKKGKDTIKGGMFVGTIWAEDINEDSVKIHTFRKVMLIRKPVFIR